MAKNQNRKISPKVLEQDMDAYAALLKITGYAPNNPAYSLATVKTIHDAVWAAQEKTAQSVAAAEAAKDDEIAAEWKLHNALLGVKAQVTGQFGNDSNEVQSLGLKKASDRRSPSKKKSSKAA